MIYGCEARELTSMQEALWREEALGILEGLKNGRERPLVYYFMIEKKERYIEGKILVRKLFSMHY